MAALLDGVLKAPRWSADCHVCSFVKEVLMNSFMYFKPLKKKILKTDYRNLCNLWQCNIGVIQFVGKIEWVQANWEAFSDKPRNRIFENILLWWTFWYQYWIVVGFICWWRKIEGQRKIEGINLICIQTKLLLLKNGPFGQGSTMSLLPGELCCSLLGMGI